MNNIRITYVLLLQMRCKGKVFLKGFKDYKDDRALRTIGTIRKEGWLSRTPDCWIA